MRIAVFQILLVVAVQAAIAQKPVREPDSTGLIGQVYLDADIVGKLAAAFAATLANGEAKKRFNVEPFSATNAKAIFRGDRWEWKARVGYGKGDLQATVSFAQDGSQQNVEILPLTNEVQRQF
jgi:hypothetical protein